MNYPLIPVLLGRWMWYFHNSLSGFACLEQLDKVCSQFLRINGNLFKRPSVWFMYYGTLADYEYA